MRDPDIREALVARLRASHPDPTENLIRSEMGLGLGASRVDVALVNGRLTGYEIKSDYDRLDRLPGQVDYYGRCLDRAVVVVSDRRAESIASHVPPWWGILAASPGGPHAVTLKERRRGRKNPQLDPFSVAQLLWRDEAFAVLRESGRHDIPSRCSRWELWDELARLPIDELRDAVRSRLKARAAG